MVAHLRGTAPFAVVTALCLASVLTGCGAFGQAQADPTWVDRPDLPPAVVQPDLPNEDLSSGTPGKPNQPNQPEEPGESTNEDPNVVATNLDLPSGIALLPDGYALVGEKETGRILRVPPQRGGPVKEEMRITGLDGPGGGGLLDLALSPQYTQNRLIFAYITTPADNRVVKFDLGGAVQEVLTGIPRGKGGNGGRIEFDATGHLYIATSDADNPAASADPTSLAGKILRITTLGDPAHDNPNPASPVYATGFHNVTGLCADQRGTLFAVDIGNSDIDEINIVRPGGNYGWPNAVGKGTQPGSVDPVQTLPAPQSLPAGCAAQGFGLFVTAMDGTKLWAVALDGNGNASQMEPKPLLEGEYGRLRSVTAAPDGALWLTTSNRDGHGSPIEEDDRVIRIMPPSDTTTSPV